MLYPIKETGPNHSIGINFITGKRVELSVSANYFAAKVENDIIQYADNSNNQYSERNYIFDGTYYNEKMNSRGASLALKVFRKDRFAPVGPYAKWEVIFYSSQLTIKPYKIFYPYNNVTVEYGGVKELISAGGAFGFGRQKVLNDRIVIDLGLRGAIVYTVNLDYGATYYEQNLLDKVFDKMVLQQLINIRLGIGFLAF